MHSFNGKSCYISYNSDMSGDIIITPKQSQDTEIGAIEILGKDVLDFVAEYVRGIAISSIEQMDTDEILTMIKKCPPD